MEIKNQYSFQSDSLIVNHIFQNQDNYLIDYSFDVPKEYCIIYFSSNDLYFPNNESAFKEQMIEKNRFEWFGNRIKKGFKHIFIRDIQKQWYLGGINALINSPKKLLDFLKLETIGFKTITVGSSAGGYAAVIYGQQLNAEMIFSFNGQFELKSLLENSNERIDPLIFRKINEKNVGSWYNSKNYIQNPKSIFYFHSSKSNWDIKQRQFVSDLDIRTISFISKNHGLPFYRFNLRQVINMNYIQLAELEKKAIYPFEFSRSLIGFYPTISLYCQLVLNYIIKITIRKTNYFYLKITNNLL